MVEAQRLIDQAYPETCTLRISLPMGISFNGHAGAIDWIQSRFKKERPATLYFDEIRTPTYTDCGNALYDARTGFWAAMLTALGTGAVFSARIMSTDVPLVMFWALALLAYVRLLHCCSRCPRLRSALSRVRSVASCWVTMRTNAAGVLR